MQMKSRNYVAVLLTCCLMLAGFGVRVNGQAIYTPPSSAATPPLSDAALLAYLLGTQGIVVTSSTYNASGSGTTTTGSVNSGSTALTVTSSATFTVGQGIFILGAGAAGANLVTSVAAIPDATHITLGVAASTTVGTVTPVKVQHDDTVAAQAAFQACFNAGGGRVLFPPGRYRFSKALQTWAMLYIPHNASTNPIINIAIEGIVPITGSSIVHYGGSNSVPNGAVLDFTDAPAPVGTNYPALISADNSSNTSSTNYPASFNMVYPTLKNLHIRHTLNSGWSGINFHNAVCCNLENILFEHGEDATGGFSQPTDTTIGVWTPGLNNYTNVNVAKVQIFGGFGVGFQFSEHTYFDNSLVADCMTGLAAEGSFRGGHGRLIIEECPVPLAFTSTPSYIVDTTATNAHLDLMLNIEQTTTALNGAHWYNTGANAINDAGGKLRGYVRYKLTQGGVGDTATALTQSGAANLNLVNLYTVLSGGVNTLISDTFSSGSNLSGHTPDVTTSAATWTLVSGTWTISGGVVTSTGISLAQIDAGSANVTVSADINDTASNYAGGLLLRYVDASNHYLVHFDSAAHTVSLYNDAAGTYSASLASGTVAGTSANIKVVCSGSNMTCYINGSTSALWTYGSATAGQTATKFGIRAGAGNPIVDNFIITSP